MKDYDTFIFSSYKWLPEKQTVYLHYGLDDDIHFTEEITFPEDFIINRNDESLDTALFALHLIGGISYFKTCLPKTIKINSGSLTKEQANFWNTVYTKGLGEFFYQNKINPTGLINFPVDENKTLSPIKSDKPREGTLVPIGGGKDSMVTAELLKNGGIDFDFLRLNKHPVITKLAEIANKPLHNIKRRIDPTLFKLNTEGALNGHIPITAFISFLSVVTAILGNKKNVIMSNEDSANIGNTTLEGLDVNHQWSKSLEFEKMIQQYILKNIALDINYCSLLRPLSELSITQLFCNQPEYFEDAVSCNKNWKVAKEKIDKHDVAMNHSLRSGSWCGKCPKCAFVFCQMAAFLPSEKLINIFGNNLFEDEELIPTYKQLLGLEGIKPFECVGTPEETSTALLLAINNGWEETLVLQMFLVEKAPSIENPKKLIEDVLSYSENHAIPPSFLSLIQT